jgi:hypothetical protein
MPASSVTSTTLDGLRLVMLGISATASRRPR